MPQPIWEGSKVQVTNSECPSVVKSVCKAFAAGQAFTHTITFHDMSYSHEPRHHHHTDEESLQVQELGEWAQPLRLLHNMHTCSQNYKGWEAVLFASVITCG